MAEEEKEQNSKEEKPKNNMVLIILIAVMALLLIIVIVVVVLLMGDSEPDPSAQPSATVQQTTQPSAGLNVVEELGVVFDIKEVFIVNLQDDDGRRYLKAKISLELDSADLAEEADKKTPLIRDIINNVMSSKQIAQISTPDGKKRLKEEMIREINRQLLDGRIKNIFFLEFVVQ